ncbi:MAG TPA: ribosome biogenesis GTP-binding protein YihA/YsxC [Gemmatimonadales bacterium]|nr:ribosome biogenesis GTP-binding protein YihA/YsxC [Gemmatimonadales bacterium]
MKAAGQRGSGTAGQDPTGRGVDRKGARRGASHAPDRAPVLRPGPDPSNPLHTQPIQFVGSFPDPQVRVDPTLPEIAFIGRSNVGKSTLLNALVGRPGLARTSGSPGKTTLLNFYRMPGFYLVDLPGYGFARASKSARAGYRKLVTAYLRTRSSLAGIVWLLDIRHQPSADDLEMQELLAESGSPVLAVFTKADKLTRSTQPVRARELAEALGLREDQVQLTSSQSKLGIPELAATIVAAAGGEDS